MNVKNYINDSTILAAVSGATVQAILQHMNALIGIAVGIATFIYIRKKTKALDLQKPSCPPPEQE